MRSDHVPSIPSDDEFARADRLDDEQWRGVEEVRRRVLQRFGSITPLEVFHLLPQGDLDFRAYVFFKEEEDIAACKRSGIVQEITDCILEELEFAGRGRRDEITLAVELDSDENIAANYGGDYFLRLR